MQVPFRPAFDTRPWIRAGVAGLIAGLVFAMWAMAAGLFTSNLWAAPRGLAQAVGIGQQGHDFQLVPFVVGLMGHMMNSIIFGLVFFAIVAALKVRGNILVVAGMASSCTWSWSTWSSAACSRQRAGHSSAPTRNGRGSLVA